MRSKKDKPLKGFGVRVDAEQMKKAHAYGIDTGELFRAALAQALIDQDGKCPTCGIKSQIRFKSNNSSKGNPK